MFDAATCADFWFAFSVTFRHVRICVFYFEIYKQGVPGMITGLAPTKTPVIHLWYQEGTLSWRTCHFELLNKLWPFGVSAISDACPMSFRQPPDLDPTNFDVFPIQIRHFFDHFSIRFRRIFELSFDELQVGLRRTMLKFPCCVNRGLWDNLSLLRTIPDKHVELSSVCGVFFFYIFSNDGFFYMLRDWDLLRNGNWKNWMDFWHFEFEALGKIHSMWLQFFK